MPAVDTIHKIADSVEPTVFIPYFIFYILKKWLLKNLTCP
jgi:hypothetical protein